MDQDDRELAPPTEAPEKVARARSFCEELLKRMGGSVGVEVAETPASISVSLKPLAENQLEMGSALVEAIQYLVNRVANPKAEGRKWVNLDVGGFRDEVDPSVQAMAERLAGAAKRMKKVLAVAPISPRERRGIHMALVNVGGIETRSEGEGIFRRLLIIPGPAEKNIGDAGGEG